MEVSLLPAVTCGVPRRQRSTPPPAQPHLSQPLATLGGQLGAELTTATPASSRISQRLQPWGLGREN